MNDDRQQPLEVTPEVLPPDPDGLGGYRARSNDRRHSRRLHPVLIGLMLDALDFLTMGVLGIRVGFPLGFLAAFCLFTLAGLPLKKRLLYSLVAGVYCLIPGTEVLPLGTLLGVVFRLR